MRGRAEGSEGKHAGRVYARRRPSRRWIGKETIKNQEANVGIGDGIAAVRGRGRVVAVGADGWD